MFGETIAEVSGLYSRDKGRALMVCNYVWMKTYTSDMNKNFGGKVLACSDLSMALNFQMASISIKPLYVIV